MVTSRDALVPRPNRADSLRAWGLSHPTVAWLLGVLPPASRREGRGLFVERASSSWATAAGEFRAGVLRLVSVTANGRRTLAQVHVTERAAGARTERHLRTCVPAKGARAVEIEDVDAWWLEVLARHYADGGDVVDFSDALPTRL